MSDFIDLDKRVAVLEAGMDWSRSSITNIEKDLVIIKQDLHEFKLETMGALTAFRPIQMHSL